MKRLALIIAIWGSLAHADAFWDHTGTSYMLTSLLYGYTHSAMKLDRPAAILVSSVCSLGLSTMYGIASAPPSGVEKPKLLYNVYGVALSATFTWVFEF